MLKVFVSMLFGILALFGTATASADLFESAVEYPVGDYPVRVCQADFDGDGDIDLAVTTNNYDYMPDPDPNAGVKILMNNGDGSFAEPVQYAVTDPVAICWGDFDNDGDPDLAVTDYMAGTITVLSNDGTAVFTAGQSYAISGYGGRAICAADVNDDEFTDLCVVSYSSDTLTILENNGDGTFSTGATYQVNDEPSWVCAGDLDGDGDVDLATTGSFSSDVTILENVSGQFVEIGNYPVREGAYSICVEDLDNDGDLDLATAVQTSDVVAVLINNGDATFEAAVWYDVLLLPLSVCAADFDGDGFGDLAVTCHTYDSVSVLVNNGDGTFVVDSKYGTGTMPLALCAEDFDDDGKPDLAVVNAKSDDVSILINATVGNPGGSQGPKGPPDGLILGSNYPNPFNPTTSIEFNLPMGGHVTFDIFNIAGQKIRTLVDRVLPAGVHSVTWDGRDEFGSSVASGMYLYRLKTEEFVETRKMVLVK